MSDSVDEGDAGQDGLHLFKSLGSQIDVESNDGIFRLLVIGSPSVFESLLLLEQVRVLSLIFTRGFDDPPISRSV